MSVVEEQAKELGVGAAGEREIEGGLDFLIVGGLERFFDCWWALFGNHAAEKQEGG